MLHHVASECESNPSNIKTTPAWAARLRLVWKCHGELWVGRGLQVVWGRVCRWRRCELGWVIGGWGGWGGVRRTQAAGACSAFLRCCQHSLLSNYLSVKTCTELYFRVRLGGSNWEKRLGSMWERDRSLHIRLSRIWAGVLDSMK